MTTADFIPGPDCPIPDACGRWRKCDRRTADALDAPMASDADLIADDLPPRARILREAEALICGPREADYGPPSISFARAAALATLATGHRLTARDVVEVLHAVKTVRLRQDPAHPDSLVDRIGYGALAAEVSDDFADTVAALGASEGQP